ADGHSADSWRRAAAPAPESQGQGGGPGDATGAVLRGRAGAPETPQTFQVLRPADAAPATYTLRSDAPWLTAPGALALRSARSTVQLRVARHGLAAPGASVGTVTGWGPDTLAGPAFRLVTTVIAAAPAADGTERLREGVAVPAGGTLRTFFQVDSARPFALTVA